MFLIRVRSSKQATLRRLLSDKHRKEEGESFSFRVRSGSSRQGYEFYGVKVPCR